VVWDYTIVLTISDRYKNLNWRGGEEVNAE